MKKILLFACAAVFAFASCGNKTAAPAEEADSTSVEAIAETAEAAVSDITAALQSGDATKVQGVLETLQATYAKLVEEGKLEDAKAYASKIQEFIAAHKDDIQNVASGNTTLSSLIGTITNLPTSAEATAEELKSAIQADGNALVGGAKDAAESAVKDSANQAKDAAVQKATEAAAPVVEKAQQAKEAADAAKNAADAAKKLLGK